jgi:hypothetical protein
MKKQSDVSVLTQETKYFAVLVTLRYCTSDLPSPNFCRTTTDSEVIYDSLCPLALKRVITVVFLRINLNSLKTPTQ